MAAITSFQSWLTAKNVIPIALGNFVGVTCTRVTNSLSDDILNPLVTFVGDPIHLTDWKILIRPASEATADQPARKELSVNMGNFLLVGLQFLVMVLLLYLTYKVFDLFDNASMTISSKLHSLQSFHPFRHHQPLPMAPLAL